MDADAQAASRRRLSTRQYTLLFQSFGLPIVLACPAYIIFAYYASVAPWGFVEPLLLAPFVSLAGLAAIPGIIILSLVMISDKLRRFAANAMVLCLLLVLLLWSAVRMGYQIRRQAFIDLAARSAPLVQAIHRYESDMGKPPAQLADLVPQYLPQIPGTDMGAYPDYRYEVQSAPQSGLFPNERWALWVSTSMGPLDFDMFIYLPSQNYQSWIRWFGTGNVIEPMGDWAYVHE